MSEALQPTFRPVGDRDREFLRGLFFTSWDRALASAEWTGEMKGRVLDQQFEAQDIGYRRQYPAASFELILLGGQPVGRVYVDRARPAIELIDLTLLPAFRNRGIGTGIMRLLIAEALTTGRRVELYVEKWNPGARRFYLRHGFADLDDIGSHWKMHWTPGAGAGSHQQKTAS